MPRESLSGITPEQSMESLGNLLEAVQEKIKDATDRDVASLDREKIREWIEIDQSIERNIEKFVDYRKRVESDSEATAQIKELQSEQEDLRRRAKELVSEFVAELEILRESGSTREEATVVESPKENKEKQKLLEEAERIKGGLQKLFDDVKSYRDNLERKLRMSEGLGAGNTKKVIISGFRANKQSLDQESAEFKSAISKLNSSERAEFTATEDEIAVLSVHISDGIDEIETLDKQIESSPAAAALGSVAGIDGKKEGPIEGGPAVFDSVNVPHEPAVSMEEIDGEFPEEAREEGSDHRLEVVDEEDIEKTEFAEDNDQIIPQEEPVEVPVLTAVAETPEEPEVAELIDGLDGATADVIKEAIAAIKDIEVRKKAKKILSDAFRGLDEGKAGQMFLILEFLSYQRELPEQIVAIQSKYGENKLADKLKTVVDRASYMLKMIASDPEKAELAGRTTVEMAEKLHKWCDEHELKGKFFADDEEKYKTSMYWDIAKYDAAVHGGLAIGDANPEKKVYKNIADLKKAQFVKDGAMDVEHPEKLTEDELKEIVARCYFDASPLDKNTEAKLRQELSVARMKMWFEEEHEKKEYKEEHDGSTDGFEYSFTKKLRKSDELVKAEKEGSALFMSALDVAYRGRVEVVLETPLVPGAVRRTRKELQNSATDPKMDKSEHGKSLLRILEAWVKKEYAKDKVSLEFDELTKKWNGAGVDDWIREVGVAEEKKAKAEFDEMKKRISAAEAKEKKIRSDVRAIQSIVDIAQGGSLTRGQYTDAKKSLSKEINEQWRSSPEFRGTDERSDLVAFSKRILIETERLARIEDEKADELRQELAKFKSYAWAHEEVKGEGGHPPKAEAKHASEGEGGGHDDPSHGGKPAADVALETLAPAGHHHAESKEKKPPEFKTIPYEEIPGKPETGSDSPEVFFDGWEYGHRKSLDLLKFWDRLHKKSLDWLESRDTVQSEYDNMPEEQKQRLANTLSAIRAEDTTSAAFYETPDPYFKKGYKGEGTKRKGKEDKPKEELLKGVLEPRPFGLKRQELEKIFAQQAKPGANGEQQKGVFWTQIPSTNVPKHEGERQLFLISLHTTDNKLGEGKPVKFYLDVKKEVAERINALLTHDADNAIHIVRGLAKVYSYERFADVPFHHGQTMHAEVPWSSEKKKLEIAPPLPNRPKAGPPIDHGRRNFMIAAGVASIGVAVGKNLNREHVARVWRKRRPRSEDENNWEGDPQNVREYKEGDAKFAPHYTSKQLEASLDGISAAELESLYGQKIDDPKTFLRARLQQIFDRTAIPAARGALSIGEKSVVSGVEYFEQFKKDKPKIIAAVLEASERHGVPADVIFGVLVKESRGYRGAVSGPGAKGLMQVMDGTATKDLGWTQSDWEKNWQQIRPNIDTGTRYLKKLDKMFGGRKDLVFAAYNGGPTGVLNMVERYAKDVLRKENVFDKDKSKRNIVNARALRFIEDNHINMLLIYEYYRVKRGMKEDKLPETMFYVFAVDALTVGAPAKWMGEETKEAEKNRQQTASNSPDGGVSSADGGANYVEKLEEDRLIIEENPDEEVPTIDLTNTSTSGESDDILEGAGETPATNTSTQADAGLSRRELLRGKKPEKAAEAPKGLSVDGKWAKKLVSELDKFSNEKMNRAEKDKLIQAILSAEERTNNIARSTAPLSKEDYDAIIEVTKKVIEKMQWADSKLGIVYIQSKQVETMNKKLKYFGEKRRKAK